MKNFIAIIITGSIIIFSSCKKQDVTPIEATIENAPMASIEGPLTATSVHTYILGHKGAGSNNYNPVNMEHSIASFKQALLYLDGAEIDLEMSLDGTLWMQHATNISTSLCSPVSTMQSVITMHDADIAKLQLCSRTKKDRLYKFSELMTLWNSTAKGFYISIEIKGDFEKVFYDKVGGVNKYLTAIADKLGASLSSGLKHPAGLLITEVNSPVFLNEFRKFKVANEMKNLLFEYKSFDLTVADAIKYKFDGVSNSFTDTTMTAAKVKSVQDKKLFVQVWTPYTSAELSNTYSLHPNFIQTDNIKAKQILKLP